MREKISTLFVGVDTHKETHTLVSTNVVCEPICELTFNNDWNGFCKAFDCIQKHALENNFNPIVGLEDTTGNGLAFARFLNSHNLPVKTVNPVLVDRNRSKSAHPEKSDSRDAQGVAEVLVRRTDTLPDYTITKESEFARDVKVLVDDREDLIVEQTKLKNKLHASLNKFWGVSYKKIYQKNIFGKRSLIFWNKYPSAVDFKKTTKPMIEKPKWIKKAKINELPYATEIEKKHVKRLLHRLIIIQSQLTEIEKELSELTKNNYSYLTSIPGCAVVTASKLIAFTKDINFFPSEKQLARYTGIAPVKYESGKIKRDRSSSRGHSALRRAFKTIALSQIGNKGCQKSKEYYRKKIKEGKTKKQALKSLMRQNVRIVYKIMKERRNYY